jgi:thiamine biosynthesis lipoprotein
MPRFIPFSFSAMGSDCVLHLPSEAGSVAEQVEAEVLRIEYRYSRYRPDSVLSKINRVAMAGGSITVDEETAALIDHAFACHVKSKGRFDVTTGILRQAWNFSTGQLPATAEVVRLLPLVGMGKLKWERPVLSFPLPGMELDLGGIGKEYAADCAASVCRRAGVNAGLIDFGGDLFALGPREPEHPWLVHLRHPRRPHEAVATVPLTQGGLATSGDYERCMVIQGKRYSHILNPATGWPIEGLASISVAAPTCLLAGSLATIAMLRGKDGPRWLDQLGVACFWVDSEERCGGSLA